MHFKKTRMLVHAVKLIGLVMLLAGPGAVNAVYAQAVTNPETPDPDATTATRTVVGTIKSMLGRSITVAPGDTTFDVTVLIPLGAEVVAVEPGQHDLKGAAPMALNEMKTGDRVEVHGVLSDDNSALVASVIMVTRGLGARSSATQRADDAQLMVDWQKRGVGGVVTSVDPVTGLVKIKVMTAGGDRTITVHNNRDAVLRRYAPDSVKLADTMPAVFNQIQVGDQLQARGARSRDGRELTADEIVFGSFRNITGTIESIDAVDGKLTVTDRATKQSIVVRLTSRSQIRKLPLLAAQDIALRLKSAVAETPRPAPDPAPDASPILDAQADFQQTVSRMPDASLEDLDKGGAVMVVATPGENPGSLTAVILVGGVEPILTGSLDDRGEGLTLSPWSLGPGAGNAPVANP